MLEIRNRKTRQSIMNVCKSDVIIGDYAHSLRNTTHGDIKIEMVSNLTFLGSILDTSLSWKCYTKMIAIKIFADN